MLGMVVQNLCFVGFLGLLLFPAAGTLAWPQGWAFLAVFDACTVVFGVWLAKVDPDLLAERKKSPLGAGQKPRDRAIMAGIAVGFVVWLVFMAVDARRLAWSPTPLWAQVVGAGLIVAGFIGCALVVRANTFAVSTIRLQPERGQVVISTGPYAVVRHPMYASALLIMVGTPLLLGSLWGLVGLMLLMPVLMARAVGEEALLLAGLAGYSEYAARVRYRLVPGVW
jgi:protein-S-isoprenylcysteine O-methyltransferase Ste14